MQHIDLSENIHAWKQLQHATMDTAWVMQQWKPSLWPAYIWALLFKGRGPIHLFFLSWLSRVTVCFIMYAKILCHITLIKRSDYHRPNDLPAGYSQLQSRAIWCWLAADWCIFFNPSCSRCYFVSCTWCSSRQIFNVFTAKVIHWRLSTNDMWLIIQVLFLDKTQAI